jgi:hypothetical protein
MARKALKKAVVDATPGGMAREDLARGIEALKGFGLTVEHAAKPKAGEGVDAWLRVGRGRDRALYAAMVRRRLAPAALGPMLHPLAGAKGQVMLIADYVAPPVALRLREKGVAFVDAVGNAWIEQPGLVIWHTGNKPVRPPKAGQAVRVFQPAGIQVVFALLCDPERVDAPVREIAKMAGVAHGTVGRILEDLRHMGYVVELGRREGARGRARRRRLQQRRRLLDLWVEAYAQVLRPRLDPRRYRPLNTLARDWWKKAAYRELGTWLGGEGAAEIVTRYLKPQDITIYADDRTAFLKKHKLVVDPQGPVIILDRFWRFEFKWEYPDMVPPVLIYADLLATGDDRCRETAVMVYDKYLAKTIAAD